MVRNTSSGSSDINERKGKTQIQEDKARRKRKKSVCFLWHICFHFSSSNFSNVVCFPFIRQQFASRLQMTEDELVVHFFRFDGK